MKESSSFSWKQSKLGMEVRRLGLVGNYAVKLTPGFVFRIKWKLVIALWNRPCLDMPLYRTIRTTRECVDWSAANEPIKRSTEAPTCGSTCALAPLHHYKRSGRKRKEGQKPRSPGGK